MEMSLNLTINFTESWLYFSSFLSFDLLRNCASHKVNLLGHKGNLKNFFWAYAPSLAIPPPLFAAGTNTEVSCSYWYEHATEYHVSYGLQMLNLLSTIGTKSTLMKLHFMSLSHNFSISWLMVCSRSHDARRLVLWYL